MYNIHLKQKQKTLTLETSELDLQRQDLIKRKNARLASRSNQRRQSLLDTLEYQDFSRCQQIKHLARVLCNDMKTVAQTHHVGSCEQKGFQSLGPTKVLKKEA